MSQREKLHFKYPKIRKGSQSIDNKNHPLEPQQNYGYSPRFLQNLDSLCEKLQSNMKSQNLKIDNFENKYFQALLGKFDKLISVNQKIGKNLERLVEKFDPEDKTVKNEYLLPPINSQYRGNAVGFKALSTRRLMKSQTDDRGNETPRRLEGSSSSLKLRQKESKNANQQQNTVDVLPDNKQIETYQIQYRNVHKPVNLESENDLHQAFQKIIQAHCSQQVVSVSLNKFIGTFYNKKTEFYYSEFSAGKLRYDDLKIKFSTDIINEAIELSRRWMDFVLSKKCPKVLDTCVIKGKDFFRLFNEASKNSLEYLIHKYPPSRTKQIDTELSDKIKEVKTFSIVKYDLLRNAGMEFGEKKGQTDFSSEIKEWVNKLIIESKRQFPKFKQTMKDIFTNNEGSLDGSKLDCDVDYIIGSKIPQNTAIYTDEEIELPGLPIKNPEILRVLIKWFEELYSYFTNTKQKILENKHGFKSNKFKSVPIRMPHSRLEKLMQKLDNIYQSKVKPFKKGIFRNLGELLEGLIATSMAGMEGYDFLDSRQVIITKLASILYQTFKQYILIFLNGIMSFLVDVKNQYDNSASQSVISLISFTLMDLLRCKCVGTKKEIYRIYNQILEKKDYFEVIRVKNKLNEPTRDILINLKLKNSFLICEVQLSLGSNKQETNDQFCHFLYELERSQFGTLFQCASQISNLDPKVSYIKKHKDLKFKKFSGVSELLKTKIQIKDGDFYCSVSHGETKMEMVPSTTPFCCIYCNSFIESNRLRLPYFKCFRCAVCICTQCIGYFTTIDSDIMAKVFANADGDKKCIPDEFYKDEFVYNGAYEEHKVREQLKKVLQTNQYAVLCIVNKVGCHQIIFKKYRVSITQTFSTIKQMPPSNIDHEQKTALSCIVTLKQTVKKNLSDLEGYMKYHISMEWNELDEILLANNIKEVICIVDEKIKSVLVIDVVETETMIDSVRLQKTLSQTVRKLNKNKQNYLQVTSKNIESLEFLQSIQNKKNFTTINLWQNKITNIDILSEFTNLEELYLQQNLINSINPLLVLNKIQVLGLSENNVTGILPKLVMPNLQCLILSNNKISDISNLSISSLPNLIFIKLYKNPLLTTLPELDLPKLEVIMLNDCAIKNVAGFSRSRLPSLTNIELSNNQIEGILTSFSFPELLNLHISKNKISSLSVFIKSKLPKLKTLDLRFNEISDHICDLNLPQLRELLLANNRITYIGEEILYCKKLPLITTIDLRYNNISGRLPRFKLKTLKKLDFGYNKLSDISELEHTIFHSIEQIKLDHNQIECRLPVVSFKTLKMFDLSYNFIADVGSLNKWSVSNIEDIKLNNNKITCEVPKMEMYSLKYLNLSNNHIKQESLLQNIHLTPSIMKINLAANSSILVESIKKKYQKDSLILKTVEI